LTEPDDIGVSSTTKGESRFLRRVIDALIAKKDLKKIRAKEPERLPARHEVGSSKVIDRFDQSAI
jgi:hypothetical protein